MADETKGADGAAAATSAATTGPSLLDAVKTEEAKTAPTGHPATAETPPGEKAKAPDAAAQKAAKPDWLGDEFWDAEKGEARMEALAKSQRDLRQQVSKGTAKPPAKPEDYKIALPEGAPADLIKPDDPVMDGIRKAAHAAGVSQQQFEALSRPFLEAAAKAIADAPKPKTAEQTKAEEAEFVKAEMAKLGPTAEAQVGAIATWGKGLVQRGVLSQDEFNEFRYAAGTAAGLRMLTKLRALSGEQAVPIDSAAIGEEGSLQDYYRLMGSDKADDKAKARRLLENLAKRGLLPDRPPPGIGVA